MQLRAVRLRAARRRDLADAPRRTLLLLLLCATVVLLIVGLLGMHALSGGSSHGTGAEPGAALTSIATHDSHPSEAPHAPDAPGHVGLTACVLALLAGLLLLVPPAPGRRASATVTVPWSVRGASAARLFLPPPSLTLLSISRT